MHSFVYLRFNLLINIRITFEFFFLADIYEAVYSYEATEPTDLSFNVGERIIVLKRDGNWWTGKIGDRTGTFPNNYVQRVDNVSSNRNGHAL